MSVLRLLVCLVLAPGCALTTARPVTWTSQRSLDAVVVPGCPSRSDGSLSRCQRERIVWAAKLFEEGVTDTLIVSGAAVYTPYVEAEALAAGLVALGVPNSQILLEPHALHSDQNGAYALELSEAHGHESLGVASHAMHANTIKALARSYGHRMIAFELNWLVVARALRAESEVTVALNEVTTEPVEDWVPLAERERPKRLPSMVVYPTLLFRGLFGEVTPPRAPVDSSPPSMVDPGPSTR